MLYGFFVKPIKHKTASENTPLKPSRTEKRGTPSHVYDEAKAMEVLQAAKRFLPDVKQFLERLKAKNT